MTCSIFDVERFRFTDEVRADAGGHRGDQRSLLSYSAALKYETRLTLIDEAGNDRTSEVKHGEGGLRRGDTRPWPFLSHIGPRSRLRAGIRCGYELGCQRASEVESNEAENMEAC
jgi:hypothetical protein